MQCACLPQSSPTHSTSHTSEAGCTYLCGGALVQRGLVEEQHLFFARTSAALGHQCKTNAPNPNLWHATRHELTRTKAVAFIFIIAATLSTPRECFAFFCVFSKCFDTCCTFRACTSLCVCAFMHTDKTQTWLREVEVRFVLAIQIENAVQSGRAYVCTVYLDIRRGDSGRGRGFACHPVNHAPEVYGCKQKAFPSPGRRLHF